ncbi:MAG: hypothetical protein H7X99_09300, partial [Saprospiraceae bacterium]|nr:hypothetical protein [Saprospiraceae bacterium]
MYKKRAFIFWILFVLGSKPNCQHDTLFSAFARAITSEESSAVVNKLTEKCGPDFNCILPFMEFLHTLDINDKILNTYYNLGNYFFRKGSQLDAKIFYLNGVKKARQLDPSHKILFNYYSSLSNVYYMSNPVKADSAFYYISESEKVIVKLKMDKENYWKPNYNRYLVYIALKNFEKADEYILKSYEYLRGSTNRMNKGFVLHTLLEATNTRGSRDKFNKYLDEFIIFKKGSGKELDINHLGIMELFTDKEEARKLLEESIKRTEASEKPNDSADGRRIELASIYVEKGEIDKAIDQYKKILSDPTLKDRGLPFRNALYSLYEAYKKKNQPTLAYAWIEKYIAFEDSMSNEAFKSQVADYEVKYQTELKEKQLIKQDLDLKNASIKLRTSLGIGLVLLLVFISLGIFYYRNTKFRNQMMVKENEIQDQKIKELEHKNKLLSLSSIIEGQETERLRIAQDLHDGLGGLLTTVKAHFQSIQKEIHQLENMNIYSKTNELIDEACIEVRRIAHDMVPYSIKLSGLKGALEDMRESIQARGLPCELEIFNEDLLKLNEQH